MPHKTPHDEGFEPTLPWSESDLSQQAPNQLPAPLPAHEVGATALHGHASEAQIDSQSSMGVRRSSEEIDELFTRIRPAVEAVIGNLPGPDIYKQSKLMEIMFGAGPLPDPQVVSIIMEIFRCDHRVKDSPLDMGHYRIIPDLDSVEGQAALRIESTVAAFVARVGEKYSNDVPIPFRELKVVGAQMGLLTDGRYEELFIKFLRHHPRVRWRNDQFSLRAGEVPAYRNEDLPLTGRLAEFYNTRREARVYGLSALTGRLFRSRFIPDQTLDELRAAIAAHSGFQRLGDAEAWEVIPEGTSAGRLNFIKMAVDRGMTALTGKWAGRVVSVLDLVQEVEVLGLGSAHSGINRNDFMTYTWAHPNVRGDPRWPGRFTIETPEASPESFQTPLKEDNLGRRIRQALPGGWEAPRSSTPNKARGGRRPKR